MAALRCQSPAKINLTLRVLGKRADGFHEIESLVARVTLCDAVYVEPRSDEQIVVECSEPTIPTDSRNLAYRAADALRQAAGISRGATIRLKKRIPAGAGLGGGSSNAAATLRLLNELWGLNCTGEKLAAIGATIGSDVPLFLGPPVCVLRGRGERVEPVEQRLPGRVVLILPPILSATAEVYRAWRELTRSYKRPSPSHILVAATNDPGYLNLQLYNDLAAPAFSVNPELNDLARRLRQATPKPIHLTGSGAGFFCVADDPDEVLAALRPLKLAEAGVRIEIVDFATE